MSASTCISLNVTLAHEIVGHYEASIAGRAFPLYDLPPEVSKETMLLMRPKQVSGQQGLLLNSILLNGMLY
ncbi:hypothetical protein B2I21_11090 [Chryseobacterium mucoviscidosis]|nr:hypothetical protein B2I21_11090 [Chryseobacterium mucoviscidosis]